MAVRDGKRVTTRAAAHHKQQNFWFALDASHLSGAQSLSMGARARTNLKVIAISTVPMKLRKTEPKTRRVL
jgi:hypothetical protein